MKCVVANLQVPALSIPVYTAASAAASAASAASAAAHGTAAAAFSSNLLVEAPPAAAAALHCRFLNRNCFCFGGILNIESN